MLDVVTLLGEDGTEPLNKQVATLARLGNLSVVYQSSTQSRLSWTGSSSLASGYKIERCLANSCSFTTLAVVGGDLRGYTDSAVVGGQAYYYRSSVINGALVVPALQNLYYLTPY